MDFTQSLFGRENTVKAQVSLFKHQIEPHLTEKEAQRATESTLNKLHTKWNKKNLSPSTMKAALGVLKKYIIWSGGPADLPYRKYSTAIGRSRQKIEPKALGAEDAKKLIETTKKHNKEFYPILLMGIHGGLRRGEVFGLQKEDIDLLKGTINIKRSYNGPTKTGRGRNIPISRALEDYLIDNNIEQLPAGTRLFRVCDPNPVLTGLCKRAGVPKISFHGLRHTFATLALEAGKSPKMVSQTLGHANLSTTLDCYWNSTSEFLDLDFLP